MLGPPAADAAGVAASDGVRYRLRTAGKLAGHLGVGRAARGERAHHFHEADERVAANDVGTLAIQFPRDAGHRPAGADIGDAPAVGAIHSHSVAWGGPIAGDAPATA